MSLKYAVAVAVIDGEVTMDQFSEERIRAPEILQLTKKIKVVLDKEIAGQIKLIGCCLAKPAIFCFQDLSELPQLTSLLV